MPLYRMIPVVLAAQTSQSSSIKFSYQHLSPSHPRIDIFMHATTRFGPLTNSSQARGHLLNRTRGPARKQPNMYKAASPASNTTSPSLLASSDADHMLVALSPVLPLLRRHTAHLHPQPPPPPRPRSAVHLTSPALIPPLIPPFVPGVARSRCSSPRGAQTTQARVSASCRACSSLAAGGVGWLLSGVRRLRQTWGASLHW